MTIITEHQTALDLATEAAARHNRELRCITIRLPWAAAIADGAKTIENRTRYTKYRGTVGIHASKTRATVTGHPALVDWLTSRTGSHPERQATPGAILAVADLVDCHPAHPWICCGPWSDPGGYHIMFDNIRALPAPVPARGSLVLPWTASDDVAAAVWAQLDGGPR